MEELIWKIAGVLLIGLSMYVAINMECFLIQGLCK